eukprot:TRINITY_DN7798_c4_g1_i1.p1 TRINITY_DN7798_c4_g1~~TRINITY_DN7798_c4_g1_i1.p1  ORF type:complete len:232 (+),score=34.23 TRINITY_DN7798_c4_g1_i1:304-999(+)
MYLKRRSSDRNAEALSSKPVSSDEAAELAVGLLFAAHKNPAIGAAQCLLLLLEHPDELSVVLEELREDTAKDSRNFEGANTALSRCISESLRLTAHTIGGLRKVVAPEGFNIVTASGKEMHLRHGSYVGLSHFLPNRDVNIFPEPDCFQPSRFAGSKEFDEYELTTFSQGLHQCPGRRYALQLMELILRKLLQSFDFRIATARQKLPPMSFDRATLAQRAGAYPLAYTKVI